MKSGHLSSGDKGGSSQCEEVGASPFLAAEGSSPEGRGGTKTPVKKEEPRLKRKKSKGDGLRGEK